LNGKLYRWLAPKVGQPCVSLSGISTHVYPCIGLALAPWNVLAGGKLRTDEEEERRRQTGEKGRTLTNPNWERNETEKAMSAALEKVAKEVGAKHVTAVAIAYLMQKTPYVFPIIGGRKVEQLEANMESLAISLTPEHMKYLESIVPFDIGFPSILIVSHISALLCLITETSFHLG
jgi:hypothetical protein